MTSPPHAGLRQRDECGASPSTTGPQAGADSRRSLDPSMSSAIAARRWWRQLPWPDRGVLTCTIRLTLAPISRRCSLVAGLAQTPQRIADWVSSSSSAVSSPTDAVRQQSGATSPTFTWRAPGRRRCRWSRRAASHPVPRQRPRVRIRPCTGACSRGRARSLGGAYRARHRGHAADGVPMAADLAAIRHPAAHDLDQPDDAGAGLGERAQRYAGIPRPRR